MKSLEDPIRVGDWTFDHGAYDRDADVLYLSIGEPRPAVGEETPEGHVLRYDEKGEVCGLTLIDAGRLFKTDGRIDVTVPHRERVELRDSDLQPA